MTFKAGKSGNPGGRTKRDFVTQQLIAELGKVTVDQVVKTRKVVCALIDKAIEGDVSAIREVFDRVEGKPIQTNENHNFTETARLTDDDIARLLSERLLNGGVGGGVPQKTNGSEKLN